MKNRLKLMTIMMLMVASFSLSAQNTKQVKLGHIDFNAIVALMPEVKTAESEVEARRTEIANLLERMMNDRRKLIEDYQKNARNYSTEQRSGKEKEINALEEEMQTLEDLGSTQLENLWREKMEPVLERVRKAIKEVGDENGYLYIFETGTLNYASSSSDDVTPLVKKKLGIK